MRNNNLVSRNKLTSAVQAVDRQIAKAERQIRKTDPRSQAYTKVESELSQLRQKRARLFRGLGRT